MKAKVYVLLVAMLVSLMLFCGCSKAENSDNKDKATASPQATLNIAETTIPDSTEEDATVQNQDSTSYIPQQATEDVTVPQSEAGGTNTENTTASTEYYEEAELDFADFE